jgi:multicomponent Na+:H+ antiporter subunit C
MEVIMAFVIGGIYAAAIYLMMRRSIVKLIIGFALLSHAANLLIFTIGRLVRGAPPIILHGQTELAGQFADPVPEALILTAIVISFGLLAFAIVLIWRSHQTVGTDDLDEMQSTDSID